MKKTTKSLMLLLCAALLLISLTGCKKSCSVDGCSQEPYQDGLCTYHYELAMYGQGVDKVINELGNYTEGLNQAINGLGGFLGL